MGRIASGVAHEINTPMQFIAHSASFVEEALSDVLRVYEAYEKFADGLAADSSHAEGVAALVRQREAAKVKFLLETIPGSLERIQLGVSRVAETLRATRRLGAGSSVSKHTDVNELIQSAAIISNHVTEHVADVQLSLGEVPQITAHPGELLQVFQNLIGNAADAIREKYGTGSRGTIKLTSKCLDGRITVLVADDGCGIPKAHLTRVFEPFYTTKDEKHGSGQGLAIARDIVERGHGGTLSVQSEVGRGTEFRIEVPKDVVDPMSWRSVILAKDVTSLIPMAKGAATRRVS
jgi:signal transduction histidine kinase